MLISTNLQWLLSLNKKQRITLITTSQQHPSNAEAKTDAKDSPARLMIEYRANAII
ncbi:MAG TPA: hypothetical protein VLH35_02790 [Candidatus Acidoferrales bacterium]|nr:hypothetical protein [Candidatus Acidoferrales bacterium]